MKYLVSLFIFFSSFIYSQTSIVSGKILDEDTELPLENANLVIKPLSDNPQLQFAISNSDGYFSIELRNGVNYEIIASYIGYVNKIITIDLSSKNQNVLIKLVPTGIKLENVVIKNQYKAIEIKKDTISYNVKSFANGNERKLKEILEKLPGVEVDKKGIVTVQGKRVTKMLVEGKSFFGGGTKLAVENIPADALDKIEVIDNFNEVGFLKQVSDSEELAMNVKLKQDKKRFLFGDLEAALEVANDNGYSLLHSALFYYTPNKNIGFIGDVNDIGRSSFTFEDLLSFDGGVSSYITGRKSLSNLYSFANNNTDVIKTQTKFSGINYSFDLTKKISFSGYSIFSNQLTENYIETKNEYLQNGFSTFEKKEQENKNKTLVAVTNLKFDFNLNKKNRIFYNIQFQAGRDNNSSLINTLSNATNSLFTNYFKADNFSYKDYLEWHKSYNNKNKSSLIINHALDRNTPNSSWLSEDDFFPNILPIIQDSYYSIEQFKLVKNHSLDVLFKHYWIISDNHHIYTSIGNNYIKTNLTIIEQQLLTNGNTNNFSNSNFGNSVRYSLNDTNIGIEYKFIIGNWTNKPGVVLHFNDLLISQENGTHLRNTFFQPIFTSELILSKSENLKFNYKLVNSFGEAFQYAENYTLQNYNYVFKGNPILSSEKFHNAIFSYNKISVGKGINVVSLLTYNRKIRTLRNEIVMDGINQLNTPVITDNPETLWRFTGVLSKAIYKFRFGINSSYSWQYFTQRTNSVDIETHRKYQTIGASLKTANKKWPDFEIKYIKTFNELKGFSENKLSTDEIQVNLNITLFKNLIFKADYNYFTNKEDNNRLTSFDVANVSLRYQRKNKPLMFELFANNLFDNKQKNNNSITDYLISQNSIYVLPRILMLSLSYKL